MSTDLFEDTLRDLLRDTADAAGPDFVEPDASSVIGLGRRVVRRRRYATGLVAASVLGVAGVVGVAAMGPADRTSPPAGTTSAAPSSPGVVTADLTRGALRSDSQAPSDDRPTVRVAVDLARRVLTTSLLDADGAPFDTSTSTLPANPRVSTWASAQDPSGLVQGVIPASAKDVIIVRAGGPAEGPLDVQPLPGSPYKAFASWPRETNDERDPIAGVIWSDGTAVYDTQGGAVRSVGTGTALAFLDRTQGVFGIFDGGVGAGPIPEVAEGSVPTTMLGRQADGSDYSDSTVLLVLPAGAHSVELQASEFARVITSEVDGGGTADETLVIARLTLPANTAGAGVDNVTWTNADGSPGSGTVSDG